MAKQTCPNPRILFVDDELSIRLTLPRVLASFGFDVVPVGTVDDALAKMRSERFDILVSDLNLPEPNAGFIVIEEMLKHRLAASISFSPGIPRMKPSNERTVTASLIISSNRSRSRKWSK